MSLRSIYLRLHLSLLACSDREVAWDIVHTLAPVSLGVYFAFIFGLFANVTTVMVMGWDGG